MKKNILKDLISLFFTTALILTVSQMGSCRLITVNSPEQQRVQQIKTVPVQKMVLAPKSKLIVSNNNYSGIETK